MATGAPGASPEAVGRSASDFVQVRSGAMDGAGVHPPRMAVFDMLADLRFVCEILTYLFRGCVGDLDGISCGLGGLLQVALRILLEVLGGSSSRLSRVCDAFVRRISTELKWAFFGPQLANRWDEVSYDINVVDSGALGVRVRAFPTSAVGRVRAAGRGPGARRRL